MKLILCLYILLKFVMSNCKFIYTLYWYLKRTVDIFIMSDLMNFCHSDADFVFLQIVTSASTDLQDYTYYFVPAPWLSVKLLRLLQCYPPPGNGVKNHVSCQRCSMQRRESSNSTLMFREFFCKLSADTNNFLLSWGITSSYGKVGYLISSVEQNEVVQQFVLFPPEDAAVRGRLTECLETILNKAQEPPKSKKVQHSNAKNAVLFEAISLIIHHDR